MVSRQRSPNYPGIDLGAAINCVKDLYANVGRGQFTANEAATTWGYKGPSGPVRVRLAALRQYGLLDGQRGENPNLSRRALTFVLRNQASREYKNALKEAALSPDLFQDIQEARPDASDGVLREYLILDRNFTDDGAGRAITVYRDTMQLADIDNNDVISGLESDDKSEEYKKDVIFPQIPVQSTAASVGSISIPIPLSGERMATVILPIDMQSADWTTLERILGAYKPQSSDGGNESGEDLPEIDSDLYERDFLG